MANIPKFIEDQKLIKFSEKDHKYLLNGRECISVTTFIKEYFAQRFDESGAILSKCAIKEGVSEKQLKKRWENKRDRAGLFGKNLHSNLEYFIKTGKIKQNKFAAAIKYFKDNYKFDGDLYAEALLFNESLLISGTCDLISIKDNIATVSDFKSNAKGISTYSFGKYMKYPLSTIPDAPFYHYQLQISIYLYLLCSKYGYIPSNDNCIFWLDRKKNEFKRIPVEYRQEDVINCFSHYTYIKSLSKEQLEELNKSKIIVPENNEEVWID